ncbi:MAG TPA: hypothetical protein VN721_14100 [Flavipsychrobacter sp.]|nr:hypothetical protein [Flavipsychrobacter sp.]
MRFFISLLTLAFLHCSAYADYSYYYQQTKLAEEALLNENFPEALVHYDSAFKNYDFKFARDCFIAAQTAAYLNNDKHTFQYLQYAIAAGVKPECISNQDIFQRFKKTLWWDKLEDMRPILWKKYLARIDTSLTIEFVKRFTKEQELKDNTVRGDRSAYFHQVEDNVSRVQQLARQNKFPGEKLIGIDNSVIATPRVNQCNYSADIVISSLNHFSYSYELMKNELTKAMLDGDLYPYELVNIFIFTKNRVCVFSTNKKYTLETQIDKSADSNTFFNLAFEKQTVDTATANKNRDRFFIRRMGTKLTSTMLKEKYGIDIIVGYGGLD